VHLLVTPQESEGISRLMQYVGWRYVPVPYTNHEHGRTGTLWEGRFKSSLGQARSYLLACCRYIELNLVRAGMVEAPVDYAWSSYRGNALGEDNPMLSAHADYLALGRSDSEPSRISAEADQDLTRSHGDHGEKSLLVLSAPCSLCRRVSFRI